MMRPDQQSKIHGFTIISKNGILSEIITGAGISPPFHPKKDKNLSQPEPSQTRALWDTGATSSVITDKLARELSLKPNGKVQSHHAGGTDMVNTYIINIYLPNNVAISYVKVSECKDTVGRFGLLIGMDVITRGDLAVSNANGKTTVSFRMPSIHPIDLSRHALPDDVPPATKTPSNTSTIDPNTPRNSPCPCGSKKKYKHCHGK